LFYFVFDGLFIIYIPDSDASEYLITNTSNSSVDKYYVTKKSMVFITVAPMNKSVKYELKAKQIFLREKKKEKKEMYCLLDSHFTI
jgi:hypothetical protein